MESTMKRYVVSNNYLSCKYKYIYQGLGPPTILVLRQYEDLLRKLEKVMRIKTEDVALDVGCGSGDLVFSLAIRAGFVIGLDISKNSLYAAKSFYKNLAKVDFVLGDAEFLAFRGKFFDKVFAFEVLEHLPSPLNTLREVWRLLKKEGMLIAYQQHYADVYALLWHKIKLRLSLTKERTCQLERAYQSIQTRKLVEDNEQ
jgi:ubiquinone/menaquinone biosynthesis C-methylase UbiE